MYEITPKGRAALEMRDDYSHNAAEEFSSKAEDEAEKRQSTNEEG